ncbi:DUF4440 domain-containing protein [Priestia taiwanensis]|uniref:DUF4440 domain-containing protein n=1 Tax=Priestia taiwanensis TaxID=1347902 RepID=A0A917AMC7_9BACI|nr:DUF4440 domain-containing protein [Priestia taiwanensis]MBM7362379.1 hypothetical protein [Priestia taiwanensis]GGE61700.1 hypothetical protein GCM10007140_10030 [Priestia taiwanensis]
MHPIQEVLTGYFKAWNEGFITKDASTIRNYMSEKFVGYWSHANLDKPEEYGYHYDIASVLREYNDAEKSFEIFSSVARKSEEEYIVVGREVNTINGEAYAAQFMFIWRKEEATWKLLREYIELER